MTVKELITLLEQECEDAEVLVKEDDYLYNRIEEVVAGRWFGENPVRFVALTVDPAGRDFT